MHPLSGPPHKVGLTVHHDLHCPGIDFTVKPDPRRFNRKSVQDWQTKKNSVGTMTPP